MLFSVTVFLIFSCLLNCEANKFQIKTINLKTELGSIIGHKQQVQNRTINVFYGVPYAEKPIGKLRFRRSKLINRFPEEPYEALEFKAHCEQARAGKYGANEKFSEDCLYMNIFTPDLELHKVDGKCKKKFNVMAYIYGGKSSIFQRARMENKTEDAPLTYSGELFAALKDTIFVIFNYRQELFSSLYVEGELNGNLGLFDQNLALRWVKKYIQDYCGDDHSITLFGNSLGSNAIGYHLISDYSNGLIKNAIMQSFSPFFRANVPLTRNEILIASFLVANDLKCVNFSNSKKDDHLSKNLGTNVRTKFAEFIGKNAFSKAKSFLTELHENWQDFVKELENKIVNISLGKDNSIDNELLELIKFLSKRYIDIDCLQNLPPEKLLNAKKIYTGELWSTYFDFDFISSNSYLNYKLLDRLSVNHQLNILIGAVSDEKCAIRLALKELYPADKFNAPAIPKQDAKKILKKSALLVTDKKGFDDVVADYYTDEKRWFLKNGYSESISNFMSDFEYYCPIQFFANSAAVSNTNTVSAYVITQPPTKHFGSFLFEFDSSDYNWIGGPCHADELNSIFGLPIRIPDQYSDIDREFSLKIIELWSFFARNGRMPSLKPSGEKWPVSTRKNPKPRYVEINNKFTREYQFEFEERCEQFWKPILPLYQK